VLRRSGRGARLREEVWQARDGKVAKYSLAYINPLVCPVDNGRAPPGYDNSHDYRHRRFMGNVEAFEFRDYETLAAHFREEVQELWRKEDEGNC